ncbi:MAG: glutathione S-transferase family protein [Sphingorhabdus sp.]|nr:glutathione S-transferase family protein [Sphingorhabdus sp.]
MSLKIHHLNNSRSQRILWLLEELGGAYDIVHHQRDAVTNLAPPALAALHPLGKSPMIDDDGVIVTESGAIVEYLCERHGGAHLVPARGTAAHVRYLEWLHFAEGSAMTPILLRHYTARLGEAAAPLQPRISEQLESHFRYMNDHIGPSGFFVGGSLTGADIMQIFPAEVAIAQGYGAAMPKLAAFVKMVHALPTYQTALAKGGAYAYA